MKTIGFLLLSLLSSHILIAQCTQVGTLTGETAGLVNGTLANARFDSPSGIEADASGNLYVADANNHCIRKITPNGDVSTFAGTGVAGSTDGNGTSASLNSPSNLAFDNEGNLLVAEFFGHVIRKISPNGDVSTVSGSTQGYINGPLASARFRNPADLVVVNDTIFVADHGNHCIRMITPGGEVSTLAGTNSAGFQNGSGTAARFSRPTGIAYNPNNQLLYITDWDNHAIRTVTKQGLVATLSGNGTSGLVDGNISAARYNLPSGITIDTEGNLFIGDRGNHAIRKVSINGNVSTIAGNGTLGNANGLLSDARFNEPVALILDINGADLLVTDQYNHQIRKIYRENPAIPVVEDRQREGEGTITFTASNTLALNEIVEWSLNGTNWGDAGRTFDQTLSAGQTISVYARVRNTVTGCISTEVTATGIATTGCQTVNTLAGGTFGFSNGNLIDTKFNSPADIIQGNDGFLYVADLINNVIRKIDLQNQTTTNYVGNGQMGFVDANGVNARLFNPNGLFQDTEGNIFFTETGNSAIRKISPNGDVTTIAGGSAVGYLDGNAANARFNTPADVIKVNDTLYVTDYVNHCIRMITPAGMVSTFAGSNTSGFVNGNSTTARFSFPSGILFDSTQKIFIIADRGNHAIRKVTKSGEVSTLFGGIAGFVDGDATTARFNEPNVLSYDNNGNIWVTDRKNHAIRKIDTNGYVTTFAGTGTQGLINGNALQAQFNEPVTAIWATNGKMYITESNNHSIREIESISPSQPEVENESRSGSGTVNFSVSNTLALNEIVEWSLNGTNWGDAGSTFDQTLNAGQTITVYARVRNTVTGCVSSVVTATGTATTPTVKLQGKNPDFIVYPNPTAGRLYIDTKSALPYTLTIYNTTGQLVLETTEQVGNQTIDLSRQPKGVYFLNYQGSTGENTVGRIIVY